MDYRYFFISANATDLRLTTFFRGEFDIYG